VSRAEAIAWSLTTGAYIDVGRAAQLIGERSHAMSCGRWPNAYLRTSARLECAITALTGTAPAADHVALWRMRLDLVAQLLELHRRFLLRLELARPSCDT
jgi:hypothetical protein